MYRGFGAKGWWYLLLSVAGVFTAEVMSWSSPNVLLNPLNFALTFPVYSIHYVVLWNVAWLLRRRDWRMLYVLGCFAGLYETWITKVFWNPPWSSSGFLGVAWVEVLWIGFTWHAFMSFLVPIRLCEAFVGPRPAGTHVRALRFPMLAALPVVGAIVGTAFGVPLESMFASVAGSAVVIGLVAFLFARAARTEGIRTLESLRLTPRGLVQWSLVAIGLYVAYFALLRPEAVPGPVPIAITSLLEVLLLLLALALARVAVPRPEALGRVSFRASSFALFVLYALLVFGAIAVLGASVPGLMPALLAGGVAMGVVLPVVLLGGIVYRVRQQWPPTPPAAPRPAAG